MTNEILAYCERNDIKYLLLDFFGTIVQRDCTPEEVKRSWSKKLAQGLRYAVDEGTLFLLRKKSEQAVISRADAGEFGYSELVDEIYRRIVNLAPAFQRQYSSQKFYEIAHLAEIQAEQGSQQYIEQTIQLIYGAHSRGIHINIVSDFYLGHTELRRFLSKDDIDKKIENIFVSSDCKSSKCQGNLYEYVCRHLDTTACKCIMVGDNLQSDVRNAESYGIKGFLLKQKSDPDQKSILHTTINNIAKRNNRGVLGYSNYCFMLYLYAERLYKTLLSNGVEDIYFLSREGEFLKKLFDLYLAKRSTYTIRTHYLYVSRKATYPATLRALNEEDFHLLRKFPAISLRDFFENIGMAFAIKQLEITPADSEKVIPNFFDSEVFHRLCARKDFQELYDTSRACYNSLFKQYCKQEGLLGDTHIALADVGWNGTMQDNIVCALDLKTCLGVYIGLGNSAYFSEVNKKIGLLFSDIPLESPEFKLWKYDHTFLERLFSASHGATDCYEKHSAGAITPVLKEYVGEVENYRLVKPIQDEILKKVEQLDALMEASCYCAEDFYCEFLNRHLHMLFRINNKQLDLQRVLIQGQTQNFGYFSTAEQSIGNTFSKKEIFKKAWKRLRVVKNTEIMFRILLNYNHRWLIKIIYFFYFIKLQKGLKNDG